jgi:hypothetical protein
MAEHRHTCPLCREVEHGQMVDTLGPFPIAYQ